MLKKSFRYNSPNLLKGFDFEIANENTKPEENDAITLVFTPSGSLSERGNHKFLLKFFFIGWYNKPWPPKLQAERTPVVFL